MDTLLMLANDPQIPLRTLFPSSHWAHEQTSLFRVMETTISSYLFFNVTSATGGLDNGNWRRMYWHEKIRMYTPSPGWDYPTDKISHRQFWSSEEVPGYGVEISDRQIDYRTLQDDLKRDFELMYRWDMLLREMGMKSSWQGEVVRILREHIGGLSVCEPGEEGEEPWALPKLFW
jgi:hypothetical protein